MKFIITESQNKLLIEEDKTRWALRRLNPKKVDYFVDRIIDRYAHKMCDSFLSDSGYKNYVIGAAAHDYYIDVFWEYDNEDDIFDIIFHFIDQLKGEYLKKVFRDTCS
jgi:hypothetical protein